VGRGRGAGRAGRTNDAASPPWQAHTLCVRRAPSSPHHLARLTLSRQTSPPCRRPGPPPRYVVVDEGHAYTGAFGCHTALVLRRLRRVCARAHGSSPLFVMTSATMANPRHHARLLLGLAPSEELEVVSEDGSPAGSKIVALWNPPLTADAKVGRGGGRGPEWGGTLARLLSSSIQTACSPSFPPAPPRRTQAAQRAGEPGLTRTEGRAVSRSTYRARRQQMRVELREANAARRLGAWAGDLMRAHIDGRQGVHWLQPG
jgi:ATP-dependent helicase YprA (DUF1998 family)